ncbi:hypothetical protein Pint_18778 [Pistacia integerrima]|uniref:Uncharacterized protein n=1 Tax=Pistacia integerrima TaxID=434235 RepID=A0ACC0YV68_9ROSI|nr:hypothetical protein Pint_18778 [Pistacia integerrima]
MGPVEGAAYSAKVFQRNSRDVHENRGNRFRCDHFKKVGHTKDRCYEIVGYPANWDRRGKSGNKFKKSKATVHNVTGATTEEEASPITGLSKEQYDQLMALLSNDKRSEVANFLGKITSSDNKNMKWIFDSGASYHLTSVMDNMKDRQELKTKFPVSLPNRSKIPIKMTGSVMHTPQISGDNVLYAENFNCNRISIS